MASDKNYISFISDNYNVYTKIQFIFHICFRGKIIGTKVNKRNSISNNASNKYTS